MSEKARSDPGHAEECRCLCGRLLARWVSDSIQLKCKRCRRIVTIPFTHIDGLLAYEGPQGSIRKGETSLSGDDLI